MRISKKTRKRALFILQHFFTSPENQLSTFPGDILSANRARAVDSAATLLAAQAKIRFETARELVKEWYANNL